jgi:hypothetical protein
MKDPETEYQGIKAELASLLSGHNIYNASEFKMLKDRSRRCFEEELSEPKWNIRFQSKDIYYMNTPNWKQFSGYIRKIKNNKELDDNHKRSILEIVRKWETIAQSIENATPLIVKGRKPTERKTPPRTLENTGTCPICGKNHKLDGAGKLVNHGYTVQYHQHNGWCFGVSKLPWEVSPQGAINYINCLRSAELRIGTSLKILVWSPVTIRRLASELGEAINQIAYFECHVAKWEKRELPKS